MCDTKHQCLIFIDGVDKTDEVVNLRSNGYGYAITFSRSDKEYNYPVIRVEVFGLRNELDPNDYVIRANGKQLSNLQAIYDYGKYIKIISQDGTPMLFAQKYLRIYRDILANKGQGSIFNYYREIAGTIGLMTDAGVNILAKCYERTTSISAETVLAPYLDQSAALSMQPKPNTIIYPFSLNMSQKAAVENAMTSQVSIIQGPPGTGKTQTILNIIANIVRNGETVAVVSNNNSATANVAEKIEKYGLSFMTAFLGSVENKTAFLEHQTGRYPDMSGWGLSMGEQQMLESDIKHLTFELEDMLTTKNRVAKLSRIIAETETEWQHFQLQFDATAVPIISEVCENYSSTEIIRLWLDYEDIFMKDGPLSFFKAILLLFQDGIQVLRSFRKDQSSFFQAIQNEFYKKRIKELKEERKGLEAKLQDYSFENKLNTLSQKSMKLFRAEVNMKYGLLHNRQIFELRDFRAESAKFNKEYPIILSTTYSIKGTLGFNHVYDYVIVDEASQVDLATGVLAMACAKNIVIVGDLQQLPNVLSKEDIEACENIKKEWDGPIPEQVDFTKHSLLSSAIAVWPDAPMTLLREHYRCHPKIIEFCNQKFYGGRLIAMTSDQGEKDVIKMYHTVPGNHARGHINQREVDVIREEILPDLAAIGVKDIGIITPYRDQVALIQKEISGVDVATVHKYQGREKDAIILSSVDNVVTEFSDDPRMLNVAVSRAKKVLAVVTSQDPGNKNTNYGDLARYIEYNGGTITQSTVSSVFDMLYKTYADQRRQFLVDKHRISEYDSENLAYSLIDELLQDPEFSHVACAAHVSLFNLIQEYSALTSEEVQFARNPLSHVDFLLFQKMNKAPLLAIEVDGTAFHSKGSKQWDRDRKKDSILRKYQIPILRLRTDGSGERAKLKEALHQVI